MLTFGFVAALHSAAQAAVLKYPQVATLAYNAGFRGEDLAIAIAVSYAESGFKTDAVNKNVHSSGLVSYDRGLWQMNSYYWPMTVADANNPTKNAARAFFAWSQGGWNLWATYDNNLHAEYLPTARFYAQNEIALHNPPPEPKVAKPNLKYYKPKDWHDKVDVHIDRNDKVKVDWAFINEGDDSTHGAFVTELYLDGNLVKTWKRTTMVRQGEIYYVKNHPLGRLSIGRHTVRVYTDAKKQIEEHRGTDNEFTVEFEIE